VIGTNNGELIQTVINSFTRDNEALIEQLNQILYWFRGAMTRDDVWALTPAERDRAVDFLNKRMKEAGDLMKKGGHPFV